MNTNESLSGVVEAPHSLAEMSRQEQAADWVYRISAMPDIDQAVATNDTRYDVGVLSDEISRIRMQRSEEQTDDSTAAQELRDKIKSILDADPNVALKNKFLGNLLEEVDSDNQADNPIVTMPSTFRQHAGDITDDALLVDQKPREQFRALWITKTEL